MAPKTPSTKTILLIDITHVSVGVAVVAQTDGMKSRVLSVWRETLSPDSSTERLFDYTLRSVRKLVEKANAAGYAAWGDVQCSVGTPWVLSSVRTATYSSEKPVIVTEKLLKEIDDKDLDRFFAVSPEAAGFGEHRHVLDHERLSVTVNGHQLKNAIGQRAKEIECTYLVAGMNPDYYAQLQSALFVVTHREATIHAVQIAQWKSVRKLAGADNYVFFDFHGSFGECMIVRDGIMTITAATNLSEDQYLADISNMLKMTPVELRNMIGMHRSGMLHNDLLAQLHEAEDVIVIQHKQQFHELLRSVGEQGLIPNQAFFIADFGKQFFSTMIAAPEFSDLTLLHAPLKPIELSSELLHDLIDASALAKSDSALVLLALSLAQA